MERDFLGLSSKEAIAAAKDEVKTDGFKDIGFGKGSGLHWPFPSEVSALPQFMTFKVAQEDKDRKIASDHSVPSGFLSISTVDGHDLTKKKSMFEIQESLNHDGLSGTHFSPTTYPSKHDVHYMHHHPDVKMFPVANQAVPIAVGNPFTKTHYGTTTMKSQLPGAIPSMPPHSVLPAIGSVAGKTESCAKASASSAQLTIFYAGTVNVYEDISPEKAQAIMFLAGNGSPNSSNLLQPKVQVQGLNSKPTSAEISPVSQPTSTPPCSRLSSPLSVSSNTVAQSGSGSTITEDIIAAKTTGVATTPVSKVEPQKSLSTTNMVPSVPQARKASLARFLEKRKERVMSMAPYNLSKKSPEPATSIVIE
uniref:Protein TIFY n=1 Tax=Rhizophora mucronata TaxID=61149 RepID=A0A2P2IRG1_RHIMU